MTSDTSPNAAETGFPAGDFTERATKVASGIAIAAGLVSAVLGLAVVVWPKATIGVLAVLFGLNLIFHGVFRVVQAIAASDAGGGVRTLYALLGVLSFVVGVLALRHLLQTVVVLSLLFGLFWFIGGVVELVTVVTAPARSGRGWLIALSLLSVLAGIVILAYPGMTLLVLTWLLGIWMITWGLVTAGILLWLRHVEKREARPAG